MDENELKDMHLHEKKLLNDGTEILRVPNGWLYSKTYRAFCNGVGDQFTATSSFVPEKI